MKEKDRKRLVNMVTHGEGTSTVVAFFKVMGYTEDEVLVEIGKVEQPKPKLHDEDLSGAKDPMGVRIKTSRKKGAQKMVAMLLFVCFIGLVAYYALPYLPAEEEPAQKKWEVIVTDVTCSPGSATLRVQNAETPHVPLTHFWVLETNTTCEPPVMLYALWDQVSIGCGGEFENNRTYTLTSNQTSKTWFTCRYQ